MSNRSLAEEWEAQAEAWVRWTRTLGHDHHNHRYNWPAYHVEAQMRGVPQPPAGLGSSNRMAVDRTRGHEAAHDVLAAEAFAVPAPDPALRKGAVVLPDDPSGIPAPHDILAAEEFAMPAVTKGPSLGLAAFGVESRPGLGLARSGP